MVNEDVLQKFDRQTEGWMRDSLGEAYLYAQMIRMIRRHMDEIGNNFDSYQNLKNIHDILNLMEEYTDESIRSLKFQLNIKD